MKVEDFCVSDGKPHDERNVSSIYTFKNLAENSGFDWYASITVKSSTYRAGIRRVLEYARDNKLILRKGNLEFALRRLEETESSMFFGSVDDKAKEAKKNFPYMKISLCYHSNDYAVYYINSKSQAKKFTNHMMKELKEGVGVDRSDKMVAIYKNNNTQGDAKCK